MTTPVKQTCTCSICHKILSAAVTTPCDHTFCFECLSESLKREQRCPECRDPVGKCEARANVLANQLIEALVAHSEDDEKLGINADDRNEYKESQKTMQKMKCAVCPTVDTLPARFIGGVYLCEQCAAAVNARSIDYMTRHFTTEERPENTSPELIDSHPAPLAEDIIEPEPETEDEDDNEDNDDDGDEDFVADSGTDTPSVISSSSLSPQNSRRRKRTYSRFVASDDDENTNL